MPGPPNRPTIEFATLVSPSVNGALMTRKAPSGRASRLAVASARGIASSFGVSSPNVMWMRGDKEEGES